jgi:hypothetical protein
MYHLTTVRHTKIENSGPKAKNSILVQEKQSLNPELRTQNVMVMVPVCD